VTVAERGGRDNKDDVSCRDLCPRLLRMASNSGAPAGRMHSFLALPPARIKLEAIAAPSQTPHLTIDEAFPAAAQ
jgi:hypothetical protein